MIDILIVGSNVGFQYILTTLYLQGSLLKSFVSLMASIHRQMRKSFLARETSPRYRRRS